MAYASAIKVYSLADGAFELHISESGAGATSETEINLATYKLPRMGRILSQECQLVSGDGATVTPILGKVTAPAAADEIIVANATAAALVSNGPPPGGPVTYCLSALQASFFHRARVSAGTNNVIRTVYRILLGWGR